METTQDTSTMIEDESAAKFMAELDQAATEPANGTAKAGASEVPTEPIPPAFSENHKAKGPFGFITNGVRNSIGAVREWQYLRKNIQTLSAAVSKTEWMVQESLSDYRMILTTVTFKPQKLDQEIWGLYEELEKNTPLLKQETKKKPLFLRGRLTLREFNKSWEEISTQQMLLLSTLEKAPKSIEFYNRIHLARIKKREQEVQESELAQRNADARDSIEKILAGLTQTESQSEIITTGTSILKLSDAQNFWRTRLQEIANLEIGSTMGQDEIIQIYRNLEDNIREAPRMAGEVKDVEVQFVRMMAMHEELSAYGKNVIPNEDLARALILIQDEIPKLWATGEWDKLRRSLNDVSRFIKFYELPVRSELSLAERRKPGLTRALLSGAGSLPLGQITPVIRGLVQAIDARDKHMAGHSDAVAKLVVQLARKMSWSGEDLEYLEIAALLHDVGKIQVPEQILTKLDPLTPEEWKSIQSHPFHGAQIVKPMEPIARIAPWVYAHQERWDGQGYPDRISGTNIPAAARIISVGEAYTAMTTSTPQRKALSTDAALAEINRSSGSQFDPEVASALLQTIDAGETKIISNPNSATQR